MCTLPPLRMCPTNRKASEGSPKLSSWCIYLNLGDICRIQNPTEKTATSPSDMNQIDFILLSEELRTNAQARISAEMAGYGHRCPAAKIATVTAGKERGHWQMPLCLLPLIKKPLSDTLGVIEKLPKMEQAERFPSLLKRITALCKKACRTASRWWTKTENTLLIL